MGTLKYGRPQRNYQVDDRMLAHLAVVLIKKLRGDEAFWFSISTADGPVVLCMSGKVPLRFEFVDSRSISINRDWVHAIEQSAHDPLGFRAVDEPPTWPRTPDAVPERYRERALQG